MLRAGLASLKAERAAAMADVPGGSTGFLIRQYQGAHAMPVYKVDTGLLSLLSELRAIEKQAAEELGQWSEKREPTANGAEVPTSITVTFVDSPSMAAARDELANKVVRIGNCSGGDVNKFAKFRLTAVAGGKPRHRLSKNVMRISNADWWTQAWLRSTACLSSGL